MRHIENLMAWYSQVSKTVLKASGASHDNALYKILVSIPIELRNSLFSLLQ